MYEQEISKISRKKLKDLTCPKEKNKVLSEDKASKRESI
jgi:hypothetical protein